MPKHCQQKNGPIFHIERWLKPRLRCVCLVGALLLQVKVWDEDSEEDLQGKIFEGWLESGGRQKVQSATGFIVYSYKEAEDARSYGGNHKKCKGGNTIRVP